MLDTLKAGGAMATTAVFIPVEEYLSTVYEPDMDYVDGELQERPRTHFS